MSIFWTGSKFCIEAPALKGHKKPKFIKKIDLKIFRNAIIF